jgi:hypothetical protein
MISPVVISPGDWIWIQLSESLSALFEGVAQTPLPSSAGLFI